MTVRGGRRQPLSKICLQQQLKVFERLVEYKRQIHGAIQHSQLKKQQWIAPYKVRSSPGSLRVFQRWRTPQVDWVAFASFVHGLTHGDQCNAYFVSHSCTTAVRPTHQPPFGSRVPTAAATTQSLSKSAKWMVVSCLRAPYVVLTCRITLLIYRSVL